MAKRSVSIYFSPRILKRLDEEAAKDKRSRSEWMELHFENLFFDSAAKPKTQT